MADEFAASLGQRESLPVAGDGALFITGQAGSGRQAEQQLGARGAAEGGGQDRQPVFELGDGLRGGLAHPIWTDRRAAVASLDEEIFTAAIKPG